MFPEVGATELVVIAAIALIVVGPKDLPVLLRRVGKFLAHMRGMAAEFRSSFDEMARQSELDELRAEVEAMRQAAHEPLRAVAQSVGVDQVVNEIDSHLSDRLIPEEAPSLYAAQATAAPETASPPAAATAPAKPKRARRAKSAKAAATETPS